jgi:hypothetical protein
MKSNMQDLPFILSPLDDSFEICDPASDACHKRLPSLTIDEAIAFRQNDFFPSDDYTRQYPLSTRVDPMFRRALWALTEEHPKTISSNNKFVAVALGAMICNETYGYDMYEIKNLYNIAINSDDPYLFNTADTHVQIEQQGGLKRINIGFTLRERDRIDVLSDELGITTSGLLLIFFWMGMSTSTKINDIFGTHANTIISQFKKHLKRRLYALKFDPLNM